jgi:hypothetical protein
MLGTSHCGFLVFPHPEKEGRRERERVVTVPFLLRWKLTIVWVSSCIFKKRYAARSCTTLKKFYENYFSKIEIVPEIRVVARMAWPHM